MRKIIALTLIVIVSGILSQAMAAPTKAQCEDAMSFLGFNITAVSECNGVIKQSDLPNYSGAVTDCNMAYGENFVTEATKVGVRKFTYQLQENGRKNLCPIVKKALEKY